VRIRRRSSGAGVEAFEKTDSDGKDFTNPFVDRKVEKLLPDGRLSEAIV